MRAGKKAAITVAAVLVGLTALVVSSDMRSRKAIAQVMHCSGDVLEKSATYNECTTYRESFWYQKPFQRYFWTH